MKAIELLNNEYKLRKKRNPNFSMRSFAKWLGLSPAQLSQMMTGKRPITLKSAKKIGDRIELSPAEKKSLINGVLKDKNFVESESEVNRLVLAEDRFRLISDWYHLAILSLTRLSEAKSDPRWIARQLGISVEEAQQALLRLVRLQVLQIKPQFKQIGEPFEVTAENNPSEAIRKYHKQNLALATEKIETVTNEEREFQSISMTLDKKQIGELKKLISKFLDQASEHSNSKKATHIYNLNVQLFPVSKTEGS